MNEEWRDIPGYEGYMVSDLGRVKSLNYKNTGQERILKLGKKDNGYLYVGLSKDGKVKCFYVHRLVWEAFNGPIPDGYEINHINEDKTDCRLENLSLLSHKANCNWGTRNIRAAKQKSKMVEQYTLDGTHICTWFSVIGAERELGFSHGAINACCSPKIRWDGKGKPYYRRSAYGYIWKFAE